MPSKALVVDANILVRAVLGKRVREVIETYGGDVSFFVPESAYAEAEEHLAELVIKRGGDPEKALALLRSLGRLMELIGSEVYGEFEAEARERLAPPGSRGLADAGGCPCPRLSNLDGRHGFLRLRCSHLDVRPRPDVHAGVILGTLLVAVSTLRSCHGSSVGSANLRSSSTCAQSPPTRLPGHQR